MAEKKKEEKVVETKSSKENVVARQLTVLNMQGTAKAQRNIERVLRHARRKEKK